MGKTNHISEDVKEFIKKQKIFFVGTAANEGRVNISPKGIESFKVLGGNKIIWLNYTGSGNETAAHLLKNNRMTIMFCSFEDNPLILRLYGQAKIYHTRDKEFDNYIAEFPITVGSRQIFEMEVDLVQTSCGFGVPLMSYKEERTTLTKSAEKKGPEKIKKYWEEKNMLSIDGFETNILG